MIQIAVFRKILLTIIPMLLYFLLRKKMKKLTPAKKQKLSDLYKGKIVEGKIVNEKK